MATIIEIQESKLDHISEYAEKVVKYGKQLLECLEGVGSGEHYSERYGSRRQYGFRQHEDDMRKPYEKEYPRYY